MSNAIPADEVLEREFLELRAKLLQLAATFDRIDRAEGSAASDPRIEKIRRALDVLASTETDRAERIQQVFSRPYEEDWQSKFDVPQRG